MTSPTTQLPPSKHGNTAQACDICRAKKRRCDLAAKDVGAKCTACERSGAQCLMTHVTKPREKRKRKQMENLEERLKSLEQLIKTSVAAQAGDGTTQDAGAALTPSSNPSTSSSLDHRLSKVAKTINANTKTPPPTLLQMLGHEQQLSDNASDESTFMSDTSPRVASDAIWRSPLSSRTSAPVPAIATTDNDLVPRISYNQISGRKCSMPPIQGGLFLLQEFLSDFNAILPLFEPAMITHLFHSTYAGESSGEAINWVALKIVLGMAHRMRAMSPMGVPQDSENAQIYLQESLEVVPDLLMLRPSLLLAQCFAGIALLISSGSRPFPAQHFLSLALRVAQDLHVNDPHRPTTTANDELVQQQHVFWFAYFCEVDMSLRAGRLPMISPRLLNVNFPYDEPGAPGQIITEDGDLRANKFRLHVELALIQAELIEQMLLPSRHRNSECPKHTEVQTLLSRLVEWRRLWLFEMLPEELRNALHRSDLVHVVVLESTYFTTIFALRACLVSGWQAHGNPFSPEGLMAGMSGEKAQSLYKDAKRFVDLLRLVPGDDIAANWLSLESIVAAVVTMLAKVIFTPEDGASIADLEISRHMVHILHRLGEISGDDSLVTVEKLCVELYLRAERALQTGKVV